MSRGKTKKERNAGTNRDLIPEKEFVAYGPGQNRPDAWRSRVQGTLDTDSVWPQAANPELPAAIKLWSGRPKPQKSRICPVVTRNGWPIPSLSLRLITGASRRCSPRSQIHADLKKPPRGPRAWGRKQRAARVMAEFDSPTS